MPARVAACRALTWIARKSMTGYLKSLIVVAGLAASAALAADVDLKQPVPKVPQKTPVSFLNENGAQTVEFTTWKSTVPIGDVVGSIERGLFCSGGLPLKYHKKLDDWIMAGLSRQYREEAVRLGLSTPEESRSVFADKSEKGAGFQLGATLLELDYRICVDEEDVRKGAAHMKVKWELFSGRRQKVVYTTVTEASHNSDNKVTEKKFDGDFYKAVLHNLFADQRLAEVIKSGGSVDQQPIEALAPLRMDVGLTVAGGVSKAVTKLQGAVVTVESGASSGSGFYISREGYVLTNEHVVSGSTFVRVRLIDGRNLVGEVVRVNKQHDIALLRTDPVSTEVLSLRRAEPRVGEEVHALGSPAGRGLSGTVTRGILSARRVIEGVPYLQSDVAVNPGNSGGPLIDGDGRVLGIAKFFLSADGGSNGLSFFIPIDEAIQNLALVLGPQEATALGK
jgi:S1-C subfamily serine protease